jgi:hypothetical protein
LATLKAHLQELYVAIIGVDQPEGVVEPIFRMLEERESFDVMELMKQCTELREKLGYPRCSELFQTWWGDYQLYHSLITEFNLAQAAALGDVATLIITDPYDFRDPYSDPFQLYLQRLKNCLTPDEKGRKRLEIGNCEIIRNRFRNLPPDARETGKIEKYPAVATVGFVLHSLIVLKPWEEHVYEEVDNSDWDELFGSESSDLDRPDTYDTIME